jgi:hypothetical protein
VLHSFPLPLEKIPLHLLIPFLYHYLLLGAGCLNTIFPSHFLCNTTLSVPASIEPSTAVCVVFVTMDTQFRLSTGNPDGSVPRRISAPVIPGTPSHQPLKSTNHTCCSGGHVHGCGCGCPSCICPRYRPFKDESNRNAYTGQGGLDIPRGDMSDYDMRASSLNSNDSDQSHLTNNSYEVRGPINDRLATETIHQPNYMQRATAAIDTATAAFNSDDEDEDPWPHFISPGDSPASEDFSGMMFGNIEGSSMMIEMGGSNSGDTSSLSNYSSAFPQHSMTISQVVAGTGTSFPVNNFLPLTPECRHERTRQMCRHCIHY